ncbi:hypothetical protein [Actinoplanes derwentensis]|uniref:Uncharacterized protein n=1 Tax=Actinoplanes derwentensis TaxID=113562 RepID=A0A1H1PMI7_9ACTN|nr:hypothetical protein [Actinoplanes derwentensis]GID90327.1 hypothetical protein Ade03nite_92510 [Actinoplanes derwentensis]SDS12320.1 hypothetical protein SAMN04489716_0063 [Actinoplanes derwentensis]
MAEQTHPAEAVSASARHRTERFGILPPRILADDVVELVDTRRADQCPATILSFEHERALHTAA